MPLLIKIACLQVIESLGWVDVSGYIAQRPWVCMCVCARARTRVCEREREREGERERGSFPLSECHFKSIFNPRIFTNTEAVDEYKKCK